MFWSFSESLFYLIILNAIHFQYCVLMVPFHGFRCFNPIELNIPLRHFIVLGVIHKLYVQMGTKELRLEFIVSEIKCT